MNTKQDNPLINSDIKRLFKNNQNSLEKFLLSEEKSLKEDDNNIIVPKFNNNGIK